MATLAVNKLGRHGDGIASGPDGDVFIALSLPDEVVEGEIEEGRIENPQIVSPSPKRVVADCPHFGSCGGCSLQHASDTFLADWKKEQVKTALAKHQITARYLPVSVSPARSRRRATLAGRRTKKGAIVGFHSRASGSIKGIPNCMLLHPDITHALSSFEEVISIVGSRKGKISIAVTQSENGLDVDVATAKTADLRIVQALGSVTRQAGFARLSLNGEVVVQLQKPTQCFGKATVCPPPGAFLQATREGQDRLIADVLNIVGNATNTADLFAGSGTFSLPLAERAAVAAFESDTAAISALDAASRKNDGFKPISAKRRDLFRRPLLPDELQKFDTVVIDPPRAGALAQAREIAKSTVPKIAYVSCNPLTFARDAKTLLNSGYEIDFVRVVDQFRWSSHVELVAAFHKG